MRQRRKLSHRQLASEHARHGQGYVAAPVFGNPDAAKARELFIVAAGAPSDVERCQPLFDSLGQKTFVIGLDPGHANLVKLLGGRTASRSATPASCASIKK